MNERCDYGLVVKHENHIKIWFVENSSNNNYCNNDVGDKSNVVNNTALASMNEMICAV